MNIIKLHYENNECFLNLDKFICLMPPKNNSNDCHSTALCDGGWLYFSESIERIFELLEDRCVPTIELTHKNQVSYVNIDKITCITHLESKINYESRTLMSNGTWLYWKETPDEVNEKIKDLYLYGDNNGN